MLAIRLVPDTWYGRYGSAIGQPPTGARPDPYPLIGCTSFRRRPTCIRLTVLSLLSWFLTLWATRFRGSSESAHKGSPSSAAHLRPRPHRVGHWHEQRTNHPSPSLPASCFLLQQHASNGWVHGGWLASKREGGGRTRDWMGDGDMGGQQQQHGCERNSDTWNAAAWECVCARVLGGQSHLDPLACVPLPCIAVSTAALTRPRFPVLCPHTCNLRTPLRICAPPV